MSPWLYSDPTLDHLRMIQVEDRAAMLERYRRKIPATFGLRWATTTLHERGLELARLEPDRNYILPRR